MLKNNVQRRQDWDKRLIAYIEKVRDQPFKRGEHDCALFVCNCVYEMTGYDLAEDFRGKYDTKKEAFKMLREKGCEDLREIALARGGAPYENINFAKRGDVVLIKNNEGFSLGIVDMSGRFAITTGENCLKYLKKDRWLEVWEI